MEQQLYLIIVLCAVISVLRTCSAQQAYQNRALNLHNQYRRKHLVPALEMDNQLNSLAVKCAKYYARKGRIDHSCPHKNEVKENLASGSGGNWNSNEFAVISKKMWYDEEKDYDYNRPGYSSQTGHFTQLVWKNSKKFGFGCARINGYTVGVGLYSPPGNIDGQYRKNVLRP